MKSIQLRTAALLAASAVCQPLAATAQEAPRTIIVMDGSGSMWGQIDGRAKLEIAREAVARVVQGIPAQQELGLLAYGHRTKGNCSDIELLVPPGQGTGPAIVDAVNAMRFLGKTPLSAAVRQAAEALRYGEESATVVLVTDGLETCEADPCALASELEAAGVNFTAHVVGFGLTKEEGAQVACLAENTGGRYIEAANAGELVSALTEAISMEPPRANTHFPGKPLMPAIQLQATGGAIGAESGVPGQPDFPRTGTAEDCRALAEADAAAAAWMFEPPGSYFVEEPRCRLYSYSTEMDWAVYPPEDGWVSGFKPDAILFVRPLEEPAYQPGKAGMINRGPYAVGSVQIDLGVSVEGTETGGAALALRLYPVGSTSSDGVITYSTVEGSQGGKDAGINLDAPGQYLLRLETWGGEVLDEMVIDAAADPAVILTAPSAAAPGAPIAVETQGRQLRLDRIEIWQGDGRHDWGRSLSELAAGESLLAPSEPGTYDLVYMGYNAAGEYAEFARIPVEVRKLDKTEGETQGRQKVVDAGAATGAAAGTAEDVAYSCDGPAPCPVTDGATGLSFLLPAGWWTDQPTTEGYTTGAQAAGESFPPRVTFFRHGSGDALVLGPRQWVAMNGPCEDAGALGPFCMFESADPQVLAAFQLVRATLKWEQSQASAPAAPGCADAQGHGPDACENGKEAGGKAFADYLHRCLPGDRTADGCSMRDAATGLTFDLPENWVADVTPASPLPRAEFAEQAGSAHSLWLNPADWPQGDRGCFLTRAGQLCTDPDRIDEALARDLQKLQVTLTTGEVLRRCGNEDCTFEQRNPAFAGKLPAGWSVEVARPLADGRLSAWFWDMDPAGNFKLIGLNQPDGDTCLEAGKGQMLCEFTPYISTDEAGLIRASLKAGAVPAP
ncbi:MULTISPECIES: VWA domain-containing protein [unclassified Pannonibacter]|uniref:vWA domain-containing protein n=1 Tax=unclassified Pannonibacter TaxID=2627228 RepID=UPI00164839E9